MKPTVTISIPAYNEEATIVRLLEEIIAQDQDDFTLEAIHVLSDGSTDRTVQLVKMYAKQFPLITLTRSKKRKGKSERINQLFASASTAIVVLLDSDIRLAHSHVISELITPIAAGVVDLTSGKAHYRQPASFFEMIMKVGIDMWEEVKRTTSQDSMYTCEGQIRAFSKRLYSQIRFPMRSADDVYPYLFCKQHGLTYRHIPEAVVYYQLPSTLGDFIHQHTRFLHSKSIQSAQFGSDLIAEHYVINFRQKVQSYAKYFFHHPVMVLMYSVLLLIPKIEVHFTPDTSPTWSIISSTKK